METMLKNDIKVKDSHITALNEHVQVLQSQATISLRINKDLSDEVSEEKNENERKVKERKDRQNDK
jgi:hypothetical protein